MMPKRFVDVVRGTFRPPKVWIVAPCLAVNHLYLQALNTPQLAEQNMRYFVMSNKWWGWVQNGRSKV